MSATQQDPKGLVVLAAVFLIVLVVALVAFAIFWQSGLEPSSAPCVEIGGQTVTRTSVTVFEQTEAC